MRYLDVTVDSEAALKNWLLPRLEKAGVVGLRTGFLTLGGTEPVVPLLRQVLEQDGRVYAVAGWRPIMRLASSSTTQMTRKRWWKLS